MTLRVCIGGVIYSLVFWCVFLLWGGDRLWNLLNNIVDLLLAALQTMPVFFAPILWTKPHASKVCLKMWPFDQWPCPLDRENIGRMGENLQTWWYSQQKPVACWTIARMWSNSTTHIALSAYPKTERITKEFTHVYCTYLPYLPYLSTYPSIHLFI